MTSFEPGHCAAYSETSAQARSTPAYWSTHSVAAPLVALYAMLWKPHDGRPLQISSATTACSPGMDSPWPRDRKICTSLQAMASWAAAVDRAVRAARAILEMCILVFWGV